ncbi:MAG: phospholipase D-like domain-containing protein, partial [Candidatus Thorarchaeota archaeon]
TMVDNRSIVSRSHATFPVHDKLYDISAVTNQTFTGTSTVTCFAGPDTAFEVINSTLYKAESTIDLEVYTLSSEALIDALIDADARGVTVTVILSHDRVNSYEDQYSEEAAWRLDQAGISVSWASSGFAFTHAKFWIIDGELTFVFSGNWAPSSIPIDPDARVNREMGLAFNDTAIAAFYSNVFLDDLAISTPYSDPEPADHSLPSESSGTYPHPFTTSIITGYMEVTPFFSPENSYYQLSTLIDSATSTIDLELQYIYETCDLLPHLLDAADRGVDIRVIIPEPTSSAVNVTALLLSHNIDVKFFHATGYDHNKYICVDGTTVAISSTNWSDNSLFDNREAGAIVENIAVADYFTDIFEYDWTNSDTPTGFTGSVDIISPVPNEVMTGIYIVEAGFYISTFTKGELFVDNVLAHTWTSPSGEVTYSLTTTGYSNGIHTLKVTGTTDTLSTLSVEVDINIINSAEWLVLISEIRFDAVTEPGGEFFELYNGFSFAVAVGGWTISDGEDDFVIPDDTTFPANDLLIFVRDPTTFATEMSNLGITGVTPDFTYGGIQLGNTGDELILSDINDVRDVAVWGSGSYSGITAWTGDIDDTQSLQRDPANHDTDDCSVDFKADTPNPGEAYITVPNTNIFPGFIYSTTILSVIFIVIFTVKRKK